MLPTKKKLHCSISLQIVFDTFQHLQKYTARKKNINISDMEHGTVKFYQNNVNDNDQQVKR